jgi:hypothetical protein
MASFPDLAKALSSLVSIPFPTVDLAGRHLRAAGLLPGAGANKHTRPDMTARDAATMLIGLSIDHERGGDYAAETLRVMSLPLTEIKEDKMVWMKCPTAVEAIEMLIDDARLYPGELHCGITPTGNVVQIGVTGAGSTIKTAKEAVMLTYGTEVPRHVDRWVSLNDSLFRQLAKLLPG